ncbi:MAG: hypothetical protein ACI88A_001497 [Paraglaciecola sp.]|jgi:hypothetical protein
MIQESLFKIGLMVKFDNFAQVVFHHLIDAAEEEESNKSILAYYFLLISPEVNTAELLDNRVETWIVNKYDFHIDLEIEDEIEIYTDSVC